MPSEIASPSLTSSQGQRVRYETFTFAEFGTPTDLKQSWVLKKSVTLA